MPFAEIDLEKYLLPYKKFNSHWTRFPLKGYEQFSVWMTYANRYRGNMADYKLEVPLELFNTPEEAMQETDCRLIKRGYILLTEQQAKKYLLLL
jgi:hypothetical protein